MFDSLRVSSESPAGSGFIQEDLLCGVTHPDHLNFPAGAIKLEFKTDDSEVAKGFEIHYDTCSYNSYTSLSTPVSCTMQTTQKPSWQILNNDFRNTFRLVITSPF